VAEGRGLTREEVLAAAKGQIWSGADAMAAGLVDALGGYRTAVALAKETAGLPADARVTLQPFPEDRDPFAAFFEDTLGGSIESPGVKALLRGLARVATALAPLVEASETLTRDPRSLTLHSPATSPVR
jgi:protease-4